jgi:hypothetical protein
MLPRSPAAPLPRAAPAHSRQLEVAPSQAREGKAEAKSSPTSSSVRRTNSGRIRLSQPLLQPPYPHPAHSDRPRPHRQRPRLPVPVTIPTRRIHRCPPLGFPPAQELRDLFLGKPPFTCLGIPSCAKPLQRRPLGLTHLLRLPF